MPHQRRGYRPRPPLPQDGWRSGLLGAKDRVRLRAASLRTPNYHPFTHEK